MKYVLSKFNDEEVKIQQSNLVKAFDDFIGRVEAEKQIRKEL
jgi:hypothetical protein